MEVKVALARLIAVIAVGWTISYIALAAGNRALGGLIRLAAVLASVSSALALVSAIARAIEQSRLNRLWRTLGSDPNWKLWDLFR